MIFRLYFTLKSSFFSVTDCFSACDTRWVCREGLGLLSFRTNTAVSFYYRHTGKKYGSMLTSLRSLQYIFQHIIWLVKFIHARQKYHASQGIILLFLLNFPLSLNTKKNCIFHIKKNSRGLFHTVSLNLIILQVR